MRPESLVLSMRSVLTSILLVSILSEDSTRTATVVQTWSEFSELIPSANIIQIFQNKAKQLRMQKRKGQVSQDSSAMDADELDGPESID